MSRTLVLNATYQPMNFVSVKRALLLVLRDRAEIVEQHVSARLHSVDQEFPYPIVIRLVTYVKIPRRMRSVITNKILFARDDHTCQYCGRPEYGLKKSERLTREHVIPMSRGGLTRWDNVTTACSSCNLKKADRLLSEVGIRILSRPFERRYIALVLLQECSEEVQRKYIHAYSPS